VAFQTVGDIIEAARVLLQDVDGDRYSDETMVQALNEGLLETRRLRPDMFRDDPDNVPQYEVADFGDAIQYEPMYRPALVNYVAGRIQMQDDEVSSDQRAAVFVNTFISKLTGMPA
jgi:hypothetical protein